MKGWRKIVVNGREWRYKIGFANVVARTENPKVVKYVDFSTLTGFSWIDIERAEWKKYFHITPKQIADWLRS